MKTIIALALALLLALTVSAAESGGEGFTIEELPEFGAVDEIYFPPEEGETLAPAATLPELSEAPEETPAAQTPTARPEETSAAGKSAPAAETRPEERPAEPSRQTNIPVIITVVVLVLAVGMVPLMLLRKNRNAAKVTEYKEAGNEK